MQQKQLDEQDVSPKQNTQIKESIRNDKDTLYIKMEELISKISNVGFFQIIEMNIQQLKEFVDGLKKYYQKETILAAIIKKLIQSRLRAQKQDKQLLSKMSVKQQNQLKIWTMKSIKQICNNIRYRQYLNSLIGKHKFRCGLRNYFSKEIYLYQMIQTEYNHRQYEFVQEYRPLQERSPSSESGQAKKQISFLVMFPFTIELSNIKMLRYIKSILEKYHKQEVQFAKIIYKFIKRRQDTQTGKPQQISEVFLNRHEQLRIWTKQFLLQAIQKPFLLQQKDAKKLGKFKIGLERYFQNEKFLMNIIDNLIKKIEKPNENIKNEKQSLISSFKEKIQTGISLIINFKIFKDSSQNKNSKLQIPLPEAQYLNEQKGQQKKYE